MRKRAVHKKPKQPSARWSWRWLALGGLVVLLGGLRLWAVGKSRPAPVPPSVTGAPRLAVDQTTIDEGYVQVDTPIRTSFRLHNVGDQPLQILGEPQVELVEGC